LPELKSFHQPTILQSSLFDIHFNILYSSKSTCPRGLFQDLCILHNLPISSHMITAKHFMNLASRSNNNDQEIQRSNTLSTTLSLTVPATVHFKSYIIAMGIVCSDSRSDIQQPYINVHCAVTLCGVTKCCHEGRCTSVECLQGHDHG